MFVNAGRASHVIMAVRPPALALSPCQMQARAPRRTTGCAASCRLIGRFRSDPHTLHFTPSMPSAGARPEEGIWLCSILLPQWQVFRRALDLFVSRCGPLGARVEQARQEMMAGPAPRGSGGAAVALTIPHVRVGWVADWAGAFLGCGRGLHAIV